MSSEQQFDSEQTARDPQSEPQTEDEASDDELTASARAEVLAEENRRLRSEYKRAQQAKYRTTAYGLAAVGALAVLGGVLFPADSEVLFVLGATGLFGAVLTLYLTPGRFVAADVGERVFAAMATNEAMIAADLGLSEKRVYVPDGDSTARLYLPHHTEFELPSDDSGPIVVDEDSRGLLLEATGSYLFEEFRQAVSGDLAETPVTLAEQLADGLVEQFELAAALDSDVDAADGRITFDVQGATFGDLDRVDHPVVSFLAAGVAIGLQQPVGVEVTAEGEDWLVTCRWDADDDR